MPQTGWRRFDDVPDRRGRALITEDAVFKAHAARTPVAVPEGALVTPLARETAERLGVAFTSAPAASPKSVAVAADHGGFALKEALREHLSAAGWSVIDLGTHSTDAVDWPEFAHRAAQAVLSGRVSRAIVVDGSGVASASVACNRHAGVRAAPCSCMAEVVSARSHNDANILCLGARVVAVDVARTLVDAFFKTAFEGGRHVRRVDMIEAR
jgi:ribose 5-phosphate isomerase B